MFRKFSSMVEYIAWLYRKNIELQKSITSIFRVIKFEKNKNGEYTVDVQVINKSSIFKCNVKDIMAQDQLIECFSKSDVRLITYLATKDLLDPKSKVISLEYDAETQRTLLNIKKKGSDHLSKLTADQISANSELLNDFSQKDAHKAGYLMAVEQMILEKQAIEKFNQANENKV